jgi:hypothetical protein
MDNELSPAIDDGTSLQLFPSEQTDILVNLLESSDPAKVVLDIIQNPIIPLCKNIDNGVIIDNRHIYLLEQLMKISPDIKPCVREEALKLALHLKANVKENNENSLVVLGFLLLLSIYGLVSYFNEDYILEIFAFVAQHKIAVKLFEALGFANKLSGMFEFYMPWPVSCISPFVSMSWYVTSYDYEIHIAFLDLIMSCVLFWLSILVDNRCKLRTYRNW